MAVTKAPSQRANSGCYQLVGLRLWDDSEGRTAPVNMAFDEAIATQERVPVLRVYRWPHQAVTYGYFCDFGTIEPLLSGRDHTRRWTGGGIVEHGSDVTLALIIPRAEPWKGIKALDFYCWLHGCIRDALKDAVDSIALAPDGTSAEAPGGNCFTNPVAGDLMLRGNKIGGGAIRRTRETILYQGSLQGIAAQQFSLDRFLQALTGNNHSSADEFPRFHLTKPAISLASQLEKVKYSSPAWKIHASKPGR